LSYDELRRALRRHNVILISSGARHDRYGIPGTERRTSIPRHRGEAPTGTLHGILRDLGLTLDELRRV
jgi:hypothetical protein